MCACWRWPALAWFRAFASYSDARPFVRWHWIGFGCLLVVAECLAVSVVVLRVRAGVSVGLVGLARPLPTQTKYHHRRGRK